MAALWVKSRNLRSFVEECESSLSASAAESPAVESQARWLGWASAYADSIDPLKSGRLHMIIQMFEESMKSEFAKGSCTPLLKGVNGLCISQRLAKQLRSE
jgi:hypothetical protein